MKPILFRPAICAIVVSIITGCGSLSRSEFQLPETNIPANWQGDIASENQALPLSDQAMLPEEQTMLQEEQAAPLDPWWKQFNDPQLDTLIARALESNSDLALATLTLRKARLEAGLSQNDKLPDLSASASTSTTESFASGSSSNSYSVSTSVSYELDLWGRLSASADAKEWSAMASQEDRESTAQSLVVTVASLYWEIGYLNQRIALSEQNIAGMEQIVSLTRTQFDSGSATRLGVLEAVQSLTSQQVSHSQLIQQLVETKNALALLFNQPPQDMLLSIEGLPDEPLPTIVSGVPSELLVRRPDVRAALFELKSALASKDATVAGYFPTLTLTGSLGFSSDELGELLKNPFATLGSGLVLPFLQWHEMELNEQISEIDYQTAVVNYRKTLYEAFSDVANNLSSRKQYHYQGVKLNMYYENATEAEQIYASQYEYGAINMLDWLNAIESRRNVEASLLENRYDLYITQAKLYQALGGSDIASDITLHIK